MGNNHALIRHGTAQGKGILAPSHAQSSRYPELKFDVRMIELMNLLLASKVSTCEGLLTVPSSHLSSWRQTCPDLS